MLAVYIGASGSATIASGAVNIFRHIFGHIPYVFTYMLPLIGPSPPPLHALYVYNTLYIKYIYIYSKISLNQPTMGQILNGPFKEVVGLGSQNIVIGERL